jgi:hypothetical protein
MLERFELSAGDARSAVAIERAAEQARRIPHGDITASNQLGSDCRVIGGGGECVSVRGFRRPRAAVDCGTAPPDDGAR